MQVDEDTATADGESAFPLFVWPRALTFNYI